jgi:dTDP-4-dehydrorhamnose 3,5-epimerase
MPEGDATMIDGVKTKQLKVIPDERGRLMEILRSDDSIFKEFGQVYMTTTYPGVVKAWHLHEKQTDNVICLQGMIKLVIYDPREGSPTHRELNEFYLGVHNPLLVQIPIGVFHGWACVSEEEAIVVNIPTRTYDYDDPDERRLDPHQNDIPYDWKRKDG